MGHRESYNSRHDPFRLLRLPSHPKETKRLCLKESQYKERDTDKDVESYGEFRYDAEFVVGEDSEEEAENGGFDEEQGYQVA